MSPARFFEGKAEGNPLAQRGYSRDQRSDCKQVCIGLIVSRCGIAVWGMKSSPGTPPDVTTVEHIVKTMEKRYGKSDRIWVMDRGMVSEDNIAFLKQGQPAVHSGGDEIASQEVRTAVARTGLAYRS